MNIVKFILFDTNGFAVWSTDAANLDRTKPKRKGSSYWKAREGEVASKFVLDKEVTDLEGVSRRIDIVETYMPLRETPSGPIIGVIEIYRDVSTDIAFQVSDAKSAVLWTTVATMGGLFLVLFGFIVGADVTIYRSNRQQLSLAEEANQTLEDRVSDRTHELQDAQEELRRVNQTLETRVEERTKELRVANNELEAFSYSVSHDLRAPLRGINGFSQALLEDHADKLDAEGKDCLERIRFNSQLMAQLIDDLLELSRVTRSDTRHERVNLSALALNIAENLQRAEPERQVAFTIAEGLIANGDERLLRVMTENLLGNAWKFTRNHATARIEFGSMEEGDTVVFFVGADGAGFDMEHADKLFAPFQRLHTATEFEGTGIGLATVQRVVSRHGGSVWAHGAKEQGATIYFTLNGKARERHER